MQHPTTQSQGVNPDGPLLDRALQYAANGRCVFPLSPDSKVPLKGSAGFQDATNDPETIRAKWTETPRANIGLATGLASGVFIVDADVDAAKGKEGLRVLEKLQKQHGALPATYTVQTPRGGRHFYYRMPDTKTIPSGTDVLGDGVDVRGDGGYVVAPPSTVSGRTYKILNATEPAEPPAWLVALVRPAPKLAPTLDHSAPPAARPDAARLREALKFILPSQYDEWVKVGMALHQWSATDGLRLWDEWSQRCAAKYDSNAIQSKWASFDSGNGNGTVTIGTLFHIAQQGGWQPVAAEGKPAPDLRQRLQLRRFNIDRVLQPSVPLYYIGSVPIATPGNLFTISAAVKSGKSSAVAAFIGATMNGGGDSCLSIRSSNEDGRAVIHLDTEQSEEDHDTLNRIALRRAGLQAPPAWLHSYCLTGFSVRDSRDALLALLADAKAEHGGIHSVLIDGTADMVVDVNEAGESNSFVAELHALAIEYRCAIGGVIHLNPTGDKTRGHLGSQLERKSESNIRLERDGEATVIWSDKNRKAPILKSQGPRFIWSSDVGMHILTESAGALRLQGERSLLQLEAEAVFVCAGKPALKWGEFLHALMDSCKLKEGGARKRFDKFVRAGVVSKDIVGFYTLTP